MDATNNTTATEEEIEIIALGTSLLHAAMSVPVSLRWGLGRKVFISDAIEALLADPVLGEGLVAKEIKASIFDMNRLDACPVTRCDMPAGVIDAGWGDKLKASEVECGGILMSFITVA